MNGSKVRAFNNGVSDKRETLSLSIQERGNLGGSSFVRQHGGATVNVACVPLADIAPHIDVMKIDIEGMEVPVLRPYFAVCKPRVIIIEASENSESWALCREAGYCIAGRTAENLLLIHSAQ